MSHSDSSTQFCLIFISIEPAWTHATPWTLAHAAIVGFDLFALLHHVFDATFPKDGQVIQHTRQEWSSKKHNVRCSDREGNQAAQSWSFELVRTAAWVRFAIHELFAWCAEIGTINRSQACVPNVILKTIVPQHLSTLQVSAVSNKRVVTKT